MWQWRDAQHHFTAQSNRGWKTKRISLPNGLDWNIIYPNSGVAPLFDVNSNLLCCPPPERMKRFCVLDDWWSPRVHPRLSLWTRLLWNESQPQHFESIFQALKLRMSNTFKISSLDDCTTFWTLCLYTKDS